MGQKKLTGAFYVGNGWEWGNGMIITSDYGSCPHSLLSTSKKISGRPSRVTVAIRHHKARYHETARFHVTQGQYPFA